MLNKQELRGHLTSVLIKQKIMAQSDSAIACALTVVHELGIITENEMLLSMQALKDPDDRADVAERVLKLILKSSENDAAQLRQDLYSAFLRHEVHPQTETPDVPEEISE